VWAGRHSLNAGRRSLTAKFRRIQVAVKHVSRYTFCNEINANDGSL